jgi:leukotriene-A4 hydrolase
VGNVVYKAFDVPQGKTWKSGVWTEPESLDKAHWEFRDDIPRYILFIPLMLIFIVLGRRFLAEEETIMGDYQWGVYDLLVLPPSFPYGGMVGYATAFCTQLNYLDSSRKTPISHL